MKELIHSDQLKGHKIVVVGAGRSGLSAASLAVALGAEVTIVERNEQFDPQVLSDRGMGKVEIILGEHRKEHFSQADMVIISPGIPVKQIKPLLGHNTMLCSELELASWFIHEPVIAVTGTNGKTTTTMLIAHVLEKAGRKVFAGGNLGTPLSEYVLGGKQCDILVLEVSSFQLEACSGFHPGVGILLNFSANHLDHHKDEKEYFKAKTRLFKKQRENDLAVIALELKDEMEKSGVLKGKRIYFIPTNRFSCPGLSGVHNQANIEAAYLACKYHGVTEEDFSRAIIDFKPPPHRQEVFFKFEGKEFVNDSKATTITAMAAALEAFEAPIRLFAGGIFKGGDLSMLSSLIESKCAKVYLFGDSREVFESSWSGKTSMEYFETLEPAIRKALKESESGDTLLLSPGTASFDLFQNYQQRGDTFKKLVRKGLGFDE